MYSTFIKRFIIGISNKIRIGFNTTISDTGVAVGNIISQDGSNATGRLNG